MAKRILFIASTYSHVVNFHLPYLRAFREWGYETDVACGGRPCEIPCAGRVIHLPLEKSMFSPRNFSAVRLLRREIRANGYSLISCHTSLAAFFTRLAVLTSGVRPPLACTVHGYLFDDDTPALRKALLIGAEKLAAPVTTLLMTMNAWDDRFARAHHLGREIVFIPGMGVDFSALGQGDPEEAAALRRRLGFGPEDFLLVYGAEFSRRKNQALLLRAMAGLPEQVKLLLPGDGDLRADCMALAGSLGVAGRVVFPGQVRDMPVWYGAADAAVSSSRSEGLPFNIMEAMGAGLPVAASAVKGHTDLIEDGRTGLLFPTEDVSACRARLVRLWEDRALGRALGENARAAMEAYDITRVLPQVLHWYHKLLPPE